MTIATGQTVSAGDFLQEHTDENNKQLDENKGVKLNSDGLISEDFLSTQVFSRKITTSEEWNVLSNLSGVNLTHVMVNTDNIINGTVELKIDGSVTDITNTNNLLVEASSSLSLITSSDFSTASYNNVSLSVAVQDTDPTGLTFNTDGTKMFITGTENDKVYQYSLGTGWDISTASNNVSFSVSGQDTDPTGLTFNTDGTKMFITGTENDKVYQYSLGTGWDISTASYNNVSFSVSGQDTGPRGLTFNTDGTKMFIIGLENDKVYQYSLATGWDISTASYNNVSFSVSGQDTVPTGLTFNTDGTKMFITGNGNYKVYQYSLATGWDISTASYNNVSFSVAGQLINLSGLTFNTDGTKMFIISREFSFGKISQYSIPSFNGTVLAQIIKNKI